MRSKKARRGPRRGTGRGYYKGKRPGISVTLTELAHKILGTVRARTGETTSNIIEYLIREHGASVQFPPRDGSV